jgi:protocatechuate 3,4-dioxygenase beta subunit
MRPFVVFMLLVLSLFTPTPMPSSAESTCTPTRPDDEGPFYKPNAPERATTGSGLLVTGTVRSASGCGPLAGARIEWWSINPRGTYDDDHRATQRVDNDGRFRYETDFPVRYFGRPPHLHIRISAPGHRTLITQLYPKPGQTSLTVDFVLVSE